MILKNLNSFAKEFLEKSENSEIEIVTRYDTDGISSAAMLIKTLRKIDRKFNIRIVKNIEDDSRHEKLENKIKLFLDIYPGEDEKLEDFFLITTQNKNQTTKNILTTQNEGEKISTSLLVYYFCKEIDKKNIDLLKLAVLGMVGNILEKEIKNIKDVINHENIKIKEGPLIFPSTRPINRVLEYSLSPYIEGVTGNVKGTGDFLKEINLTSNSGSFKKIIEMDKEEGQRLSYAIAMKNPRVKFEEVYGDIILVKMFNKFEDARELSAMINACAKQGKTDLAIKICLEIPYAKKEVEELYVKYKQSIVSGLKAIYNSEKIVGREIIIINAKNSIKEDIIGTVTTILAKSAMYEEGTSIITFIESEDRIKISGRKVGQSGRSLKNIISMSIEGMSETFGGHENAVGGFIPKEKLQDFINNLKRNTELEVVKIN